MSKIGKMVKDELKEHKGSTKDFTREMKAAEEDQKRREEEGTADIPEGKVASSGKRANYKRKSDKWTYD